jgi:hypothetical protein
MELKDLKLGIKDIPWTEFIGGGILFSLIKIISDRISDVRIASIVASFPIGLITSFIIEKSKREKYSYEYIINLIIITVVAFVYHFLLSSDKYSIYTCIGVSMLFWIIIQTIKVKYTTI